MGGGLLCGHGGLFMVSSCLMDWCINRLVFDVVKEFGCRHARCQLPVLVLHFCSLKSNDTCTGLDFRHVGLQKTKML